MRRQLVTPDELLHLPPDKLIVFADGLSGPLLASRTPYWKQRWTAGKYLPDPYHPPLDSVLIQTLWGQRRRKVITESVPERFAHLPQYARGSWSYVEGMQHE
jgi:type IV secretion system protein VirD4